MLIVVLFPLGLLLLLIRPKWTCGKCAFIYESYRAPESVYIERSRQRRVLTVVACAGLALAFVVLLVVTRLHG